MPILTGGTILNGPSEVYCEEVTYTETAVAGTYTGSVSVPAGASVVDVILNGVALWNNNVAATMTVGDAGSADGFYTGVDLRATDLLAGESISFALAGGKAGGYIANSQVSPRYSATARSVIGVIVTTGATGTAGRTRMSVIYTMPATPVVATKA